MKLNMDYTNFFEVKILPKIDGEPDYTRLNNLKDELKANATLVTSESGGGEHGHVGLILFPAEYASISSIPYTRPLHPRTLFIPPGTPQHATTTTKEQHTEELLLYQETVDLENSLQKQITEAVENDYLEELRDRTTNTILHDIPFILEYLFNNYGDINYSVLSIEKDTINNMHFTI